MVHGKSTWMCIDRPACIIYMQFLLHSGCWPIKRNGWPAANKLYAKGKLFVVPSVAYRLSHKVHCSDKQQRQQRHLTQSELRLVPPNVTQYMDAENAFPTNLEHSDARQHQVEKKNHARVIKQRQQHNVQKQNCTVSSSKHA